MRNKVNFPTTFFFGFFFLIIGSNMNLAHAQCALKVEYKVEKSNNGQNADIHLKVIQGTGNIDFYLVDLNDPHKGPIQKVTKSAFELRSDFVQIFTNVPPSRYIVQAILATDPKNCQISVGGVEGILISGNF